MSKFSKKTTIKKSLQRCKDLNNFHFSYFRLYENSTGELRPNEFGRIIFYLLNYFCAIELFCIALFGVQ